MNYFFDTEFIEDGKTIDLISIGIVSEDNRVYYAINEECDFRKADDWVVENVLNPIGLDRGGFYAFNKIVPTYMPPSQRETLIARRKKDQLKEEIIAFICPNSSSLLSKKEPTMSVEDELKDVCFYAAWSSYDWVAFCQLWGKMIDLPQGMPFYCHDIIALAHFNGLKRSDLPPTPVNEHHAIADARWVKDAYSLICQFQKES